MMRNVFGADTAKGFIGIFATAGATGVSLLHHVETWLRIASLGVGVAVGIASLVSIMRRLKKRDED